jgi:shikimate kinase
MNPPVVVLVGSMGAGKTTVGRLLARRWSVDFTDTDATVEKEAGKSIAEVFVDDGEEVFRAFERAAAATALDGSGVVALGGGAVLDSGTREALASHTVVFLNVGLSDTVKRVGLGVGRPLLLGNVRSRVKALLDERLPVYRSVAVLTVETDGRTPEEVADTVAAFVETSSVVDG